MIQCRLDMKLRLKLLLLQGCIYRKNVFNKLADTLVLCPKTAPPDDASQRNQFGGMLGGFNSFPFYKSPESMPATSSVILSSKGYPSFQISNFLCYALVAG